MQRWQFQDAKNRLSQVLREAATNGPQLITSHGREAGVLLSFEAYRELTRPKSSLVEFFRNSPMCGEDLEFERVPESSEVLDL
jgi:prevent-host-death family protein